MALSNAKDIPVIFKDEDVDGMIKRRQPFVLRESYIGACTQKWKPDYIAGIVGEEKVKIHVSEYPKLDFINKNFSYKSLPFDEFLHRASQKEHLDEHYFVSKTEYYYLRSVGGDPRKDIANIQKQFPNLASDLKFPSFVPDDRIFSSVFRVASEGLSVWTHYDVMDNALIQITGRKRAILFSPVDALNLYLNGDKSEVLDIDNPDLKKYPNFEQAVKHTCCLCPGDVIYIPAFWFHNMKYLDFGIAVNVFWKELDDDFYDKKDPYGNKDLLPAQQAFQSLDRALTSLSKLPKDYSKFYCYRLIAHIQKKIENSC